MKWKLFIFCITLLQYSSVLSLEGPDIQNVKGNEFPFAVSLAYKPSHSKSEKNNHFCGGVLVTKKHVLTAKHCLDDESIADIQVMTRLLGWMIKKPKIFSIKSVMTYDGWAKDRGKSSASCFEDLAVLELDTDNTKIRPAIYSRFQNPPPDSSVVMVGYDIFKDAVSPPLTKATVKILTNENCREKLEKYVEDSDKLEIYDYLMCTKAKPWAVGTSGDSGGPVLDGVGFLVGIHIAICPCWEICSDKSVPVNIAVRISYYLDFLADATSSAMADLVYKL